MWEDLDEINRKHEEYIETHVFRHMRKQCKQELLERIKNKDFTYDTFQTFEDYIYLTVNGVIEAFRFG